IVSVSESAAGETAWQTSRYDSPTGISTAALTRPERAATTRIGRLFPAGAGEADAGPSACRSLTRRHRPHLTELHQPKCMVPGMLCSDCINRGTKNVVAARKAQKAV